MTTKNCSLTDRETFHSEPGGLADLASARPDISFAHIQHGQTSGACSVSDDTCPMRHVPCGGFPLQDGESTVEIDGLSNADPAGCTQDARFNIWWRLAHRMTHNDSVVVDAEDDGAEQRRIRILQHGSLCKRTFCGLAHSIRELEHDDHARI